jgi:hypothetical protein
MLKMKIKQNWFSISKDNKTIWEISIEQEYADLWYKEMMRRFIKPEKDEKPNCFDIDESYECWEISIWHLKEMLKFLTK